MLPSNSDLYSSVAHVPVKVQSEQNVRCSIIGVGEAGIQGFILFGAPAAGLASLVVSSVPDDWSEACCQKRVHTKNKKEKSIKDKDVKPQMHVDT